MSAPEKPFIKVTIMMPNAMALPKSRLRFFCLERFLNAMRGITKFISFLLLALHGLNRLDLERDRNRIKMC